MTEKRNTSGLIPFKPGQSGNPSGRPAVAKEARERAQKWMTDEGWELLVSIAQGNGDPKDQAKTLMFIYDQAFGKAVQQIAGADEDDFNKLRIIIERTPLTEVVSKVVEEEAEEDA